MTTSSLAYGYCAAQVTINGYTSNRATIGMFGSYPASQLCLDASNLARQLHSAYGEPSPNQLLPECSIYPDFWTFLHRYPPSDDCSRLRRQQLVVCWNESEWQSNEWLELLRKRHCADYKHWVPAGWPPYLNRTHSCRCANARRRSIQFDKFCASWTICARFAIPSFERLAVDLPLAYSLDPLLIPTPSKRIASNAKSVVLAGTNLDPLGSCLLASSISCTSISAAPDGSLICTVKDQLPSVGATLRATHTRSDGT